MAKKKSSPEATVNADATPTADALAASIARTEPGTPPELKSDALASDPALDGENAVSFALATLVRVLGDSNHRIIRRKIKVGGAWYNVEVSR
jgi:hypothetical protein